MPAWVSGSLEHAREEAARLLAQGAGPISIFRITTKGDYHTKQIHYTAFPPEAAAVARVSPLCAFVEEIRAGA